MKGPFVTIWLHNVPWGSENTLTAPAAKFSDGYLDLIVLKNCPKLVLLSLMRQTSSGTHVESPYIVYIKVCHPKPHMAEFFHLTASMYLVTMHL
jgi:sphingosine kinase